MARCRSDLGDEIRFELLFTHERKEMFRFLAIYLLHPRAGNDDGLTAGNHVMPVVHGLWPKAPCDHGVRVDPAPFFACVLEGTSEAGASLSGSGGFEFADRPRFSLGTLSAT